jgi:membrane-associated protease RseP (regulator of RpoE activity)
VTTDSSQPNDPVPGSDPFGPTLPDTIYLPPVERRRFQHNYRRHILLFVITFLTVTYAANRGLDLLWATGFSLRAWRVLFNWQVFASGLTFSIPLLMILTAHEFGHYFYCRKYRVDASLPYYLPFPFPPTGTLGAVIRIKEAFPSKRALFDIGVAGPIAGFVMLLPFLWWGITKSRIGPIQTGADVLYFGEPLLFKFLAWIHFGPIREGYEVYLDQIGFAGWWGMLVTALNLLPFGQLDGGHIGYSLLGRRAVYVSIATVFIAFVLTGISASWISVTIMMLVMAFFLGLRHPRIVDEHVPLDASRRLVAAIALVIFILCFTPVPIQMFFGK